MIKQDAFCTIITDNYFPWAVTLYDSLFALDDSVLLYVAVIDDAITNHTAEIGLKNIKILGTEDLKGVPYGEKMIEKYGKTPNVLRWALKPILISTCLQHQDKVIFVDADIYFFNDFQFLFQQLNDSDFLLTPHWRPLTPERDAPEFLATFKHGIYNAGFIGANSKAGSVLEFWAKNCYISCSENSSAGLFYDQTFLNLIPVYFKNAAIVRHQGCNVASWNQEYCERTLDTASDEVLINGIYKIVFIHFTNVTIDKIIKKEDALLAPYLLKFNDNLVGNGFKNLKQEREQRLLRLQQEKDETYTQRIIRKMKKFYYKIRY